MPPWKASFAFQDRSEADRFMDRADPRYPGVSFYTRKPNAEEHYSVRQRDSKLIVNKVVVVADGNRTQDKASLIHDAYQSGAMVFA